MSVTAIMPVVQIEKVTTGYVLFVTIQGSSEKKGEHRGYGPVIDAHACADRDALLQLLAKVLP